MSDLKLYRAKLKTRKQIMAEIPREQQGWWADVCAGETLELRDATEADLERCNLGPHAPRDPAEYLCENIERGSLVRRIAVAELTEITPRGLVAQHNETIALRARIKELEAELARRTQPEATGPAQADERCPIVHGGSVEVAHLIAIAKATGLFGMASITDIKNYSIALLNEFAVPQAQDLSAAILEAVNRFLGWKLPEDFYPDAGISFDRDYAAKLGMPIGTNLLTADQAKGMFEYCLASSANALSAGDRVDAVEGDLLPPVGSKVLIHLARQDEWVEHTVTGYYAWADLSGRYDVHRVFVRVVDAAGYDNARLLKDVRPPISEGEVTPLHT